MIQKQTIFNKHFFKLLFIFIIVIILTIVFRSFIVDALETDKDLKENLIITEENIKN